MKNYKYCCFCQKDVDVEYIEVTEDHMGYDDTWTECRRKECEGMIDESL